MPQLQPLLDAAVCLPASERTAILRLEYAKVNGPARLEFSMRKLSD